MFSYKRRRAKVKLKTLKIFLIENQIHLDFKYLVITWSTPSLITEIQRQIYYTKSKNPNNARLEY